MKRGKANLTDILYSLRDDDIRRLWAMRNQRKLKLKRLVKPVVVAKKESVRRALAAA